jgi:hypothetical protein
MRRKTRIRLGQMQTIGTTARREIGVVRDDYYQAARARRTDDGVRQPAAPPVIARAHHNECPARQQAHSLKRICHSLIVDHQCEERNAPGMRRSRVEMRGCPC